MSIYFVRSEDLVKIGFSQEVRDRVRTILASLRRGGEYIGYMPGDRKVEKHLHQRFASDREYGEWFRSSPDLEAFIQLAASQGYPDEEKRDPHLLLERFEQTAVEDCAIYIRDHFYPLKITDEMLRDLSTSIQIPYSRLRLIYDGQATAVTCGEHFVLQFASKAAQQSEQAA